MKANRPKQYLSLLNKTVLEHTLACFSHAKQIAAVVIALHPEDPYWADLDITFPKPLYVVSGGKERSDSVLNALRMMQDELHVDKDSWVMVHDAARPCLLQRDLDRLISLCSQSHEVGGILAKRASDTMKRSHRNNNSIVTTEDRENLWHALTPQMFRLKQLADALEYSLVQGMVITDEASALENKGESPLLIEAEGSNIKITHPDDLALAEFLLLSNKEGY